MKACVLGRIAARVTGARTIVHVRDMNPMGFLLRDVQQRLAHWTDITLAVSNAIRIFAIEELGISNDSVRVLHNPSVAKDFSNPEFELYCQN